MRYRLVRALSGLAAVALLGIVAAPSFATPITFIHQGFGSGTLDGTAFGGREFRITATGDTNDRGSFGDGFFINHVSATISIASLGDFKFITATRTFVNNDLDLVGFSLATGSDLFNGPMDVAFGKWDMLTSIGPINGPGELLQWSLVVPPVSTSGGVLVFNDGDPNAHFRADVGRVAVPEPGTLTLLGLALATFGWLRRKALS
jgi:PEP-CTERM motif